MCFHWSLRVYHEDTDADGIGYHANYLRFLERARTEWRRTLGIEQSVLRRDHGLFFVVARVAADFLISARYDGYLEKPASLAFRGTLRGLSIGEMVINQRLTIQLIMPLPPNPHPVEVFRGAHDDCRGLSIGERVINQWLTIQVIMSLPPNPHPVEVFRGSQPYFQTSTDSHHFDSGATT